MYSVVELSEYEGTAIEKSFTEGKIPVRKTVTRKGKTFSQTYWVKQKDLNAFKTTEKAVEFLGGTVDAYNYFSKVLADLSKYNDKMGAEVYNKMKEAGKSIVSLADKTVKVSNWPGRRQTELSDLLAAIQIHLKSKGKDSISFDEIEKLYGEVSYKYEHSGLEISTAEGKKQISVTKEMNPENWGGKIANISKAVKDSIMRSLGKVQEIFEKRMKKPEEKPEEEKPETKPEFKSKVLKEKEAKLKESKKATKTKIKS